MDIVRQSTMGSRVSVITATLQSCQTIAFVPTPTRAPALTIFASVCVSATLLVNALPARPMPLGLVDGMLAPCEPPRLSCIVSQHDEPPSFVEPLEYDLSETKPSLLQHDLLSIVLQFNNAELLEQKHSYLHFLVDGVDDLEFYLPPDDALLHFRAERRSNAFDYGANRRRLRTVAKRLHLAPLFVQRDRQRLFGIFETPFDRFGPSAVDVDAIIQDAPISARPVR
ncbi:hypothetical protein BWQ96_03467 [Gracilariopsis chorda]|uniref:Uncharacterized protein n=1 Tax=Gracilariopsis chorda TaxID=448386 RepID=A0A2V3IX94_9FLOR|nr:hypothetical protein BWQ96_03467 [Gracilariopsis chorda]|eukprot:PXF46776.1 hypothetical protein BWQ96_03467 [Gracilariopsis chorda]